jgi:cytochrome b
MRRSSQLNPLQAAVATTLLAAVLLFLWLTKNPLLWEVLNSLAGGSGVGYLFLYALSAALAWGCAIVAVLRWLAYLRGRSESEAIRRSDRHPERSSIHLAKFLAVVAAVLVVVAAGAWSYQVLFPPDCMEESCYYIGDAALPILLAIIAGAAVILAAGAWSVHMFRRQRQ